MIQTMLRATALLTALAGSLIAPSASASDWPARSVRILIPFNAPHDRPVRLIVDDGRDLTGGGIETIEIPAINQFLAEADRFADAIQGKGEVPVRLEDSIANMVVIDALFRSAESGQAEQISDFRVLIAD